MSRALRACRPRWGRSLAPLVWFVLAFLVLQEVGLGLAFPPAEVAGYWPAAGLAMGVLWRTSRRRWPVYLLALAAANLGGNLAHGVGAGAALGFAAANCLEAWLGAVLLTALLGTEPEAAADGPRWLIRGLIPAVVLASAAGAVAGTTALLLAGSPASMISLSWTWFSADAFGALSILPALEAIRQWRRQWRAMAVRRPGTRLVAEALALLAVQGALCLAVLAPSVAPVHPLQFAFPMMPGVFWSVIRFGPRGTAVLLFGVNTVTVWAAARGRGVFVWAGGVDGAASRLLTVQALGVFLLVGSLVMADIVSGRQAAEAAAHSRLLALENAVEGIAFIGTDGVIQRVNAAYARLLGRDRDDLVGSVWALTLDPDDPPSAELRALDLRDLDPTESERSGSVLARAVVRARRADGGTVVVEVTLVPEPGPDGWPVGVHCFTRDITERQEAMDRVDRLFRLSPELLCVLDGENRFCRLNPAWTHVLGHCVDGLLGRSMLALVHPEDLDHTVAQLQRVRRGSEPVTMQNRYLAADGSYRWLHWNGAVDGDGGLVYAVAHDISATKMTEQALAHARDQAVEASRMKSQFLATMSHEIRTPMNGVIGLSDLLAETELDPAQRDFVEGIRTAGTALLAVINDILDFSKIEAGQLSLDEADFEPATLVAEVVSLVEGTARTKDLSVTVDLDPKLPQVLRGDPARIRQVLLNLVGNAVKFTADGSVTVRIDVMQAADCGLAAVTEPVDSGATRPLAVRFEVIDTGIGMDAAAVSRLFQPFTQADASTTRVYGGTGLGLAISRELVEAMGGWIAVQSAPGTGTTFRVALALAPATAPMSGENAVAVRTCRPVDASRAMAPGVSTSRAPGQSATPTGNDDRVPAARVLVVEDNEINQRVAVGILRRLGYAVDLAGDGVEALGMVERESYQVILMDCQMPRMDGYTATRLLRERPASAQVPIIAMTASALAEDRDRCLRIGMNDYLAKPIRAQELDATVRRWLDGPAVPAPRRPADDAPGAVGTVQERLGELAGDRTPEEVELVRSIAASFLERSVGLVVTLRQALADGDGALAQRCAHTLRGASANVGASRVATACEQVELLAERGEVTAARRAVERLTTELDGARSQVETYLA